MKPALYRSILQQLKTAEYSRNKTIVEKISLFQCLTNKQKFSFANSIKIAAFKKGDIIFKAGDVSHGLFIISEGFVEISLPGKQPITVGATEMFGESALKDNGRRLGEAKCLEDTNCLVIGKKDM
jgi:signal-transduction protein with cAMP-binding, CBS, and nucleotidyltransferase domain